MSGSHNLEEYLKRCWIEEHREDATPIEKCAAFRRSMACMHMESLKSMSNEETCFLLKKNLTKYSQMTNDNSTPDAVNKFTKPLQSFISGKIQTDHCSSWKFSLDSTSIDPVAIFKESMTTNDCDLVNCKSDLISEESLKMLFSNKKQTEIITLSNLVDGNSEVQHKSFLTEKKTLHQPITKNNNIKLNKSVDTNVNLNKHMNFNRNKNFNKNNTLNKQDESNLMNIDLSEECKPQFNSFRSAREEYQLQRNQNGKGNESHQPPQAPKRSLGMTGSGKKKYVPPASVTSQDCREEYSNENICDERLKHIDPKMVEMITSEILDSGAPVSWDDIAGLDFAKTAIQEAVVWPLLRPDIFTGLRRPPRGILLFGPPGTGKTLIAKCIASQCNATFFSISASSLMSKWLGEAEKMVRALFAVARCHQPAVVFIDEIDSLLTQRSDSEHETSRRVKTEFLVQLDGAAIGDEDRMLLIGATNRPQELDEAARRRLVKRLYIPLPDLAARKQIISRLMCTEKNSLTDEDIFNVAQMADGFSGADMRSLCAEAALEPIRSIPFNQIANIQSDQVRSVNVDDFKKALTRVRPSVSPDDLEPYKKWDATYGSGSSSLS